MKTDEMSLFIKSPQLSWTNPVAFSSQVYHYSFLHYFFLFDYKLLENRDSVSSLLLSSQHIEQSGVYSRYSKTVL